MSTSGIGTHTDKCDSVNLMAVAASIQMDSGPLRPRPEPADERIHQVQRVGDVLGSGVVHGLFLLLGFVQAAPVNESLWSA